MNVWRGVAVLGFCAVVAGCSSGGAATSLPTRARSNPPTLTLLPRARVETCSPGTLGLREGPRLSPATGEHGLIVKVVDVSSHGCTLSGYPKIELVDAAGHALRFRYVYSAGQYVTHGAPRPVHLDAKTAAYFLIAKYRCDERITGSAAGMNVLLPGQGSTSSVPLRWSVGDLSLCGGAADAGNTVDISPFEASPAALVR